MMSVQLEKEIRTKESLQGKYLTFLLEKEEYGLEIIKVKEIIGIMNITFLPRTPHYVKGVINLRGKVIPVMDLRLKFGLEEIEATEKTCIIVVEIDNEGQKMTVGIIVDSVSEVLNIVVEDLEDTPKFGVALNNDFILAFAKIQGSVKILLDISSVLSSEEIKTITENVA
jgi:purine-binding chemotaxis protein CheW